MVRLTQIREVCDKIVELFNPFKIVLFGSFATGAQTVYSDVDLLVILPFDGRPFNKALEILNAVNPNFPVDLLARNPEDTARRYDEGDPLIREAFDNGLVMYERNG